MRTSRDWRRAGMIGIALLGLVLALVGCEKTPQDLLREGRGALAAGDYDAAEQRFNEALAADESLFEARRLLVDVEIGREQFSEAEEALATLWAEQGLEQEGDLDATQRRYRGLIKDQFDRLYREWVEAIDQSADPDTFEEVAQKGLERDNRNARLNALLSEFYQERAERFVERGEKLQAAEELEKIEDLRIFADVRRQTRERAQNLRREAFGEEARERFEQQVQPGLEESGSYDAESEEIRLSIQETVDRGLNPGSDEDRIAARTLAMRALVPTLAQMAVAVSGHEMQQESLAAINTPEIAVEDENFRRGRFEMVAQFKLEGLIDMAFDYAEHRRTQQENEGSEEAGEEQGEGDEVDSAEEEEISAE